MNRQKQEEITALGNLKAALTSEAGKLILQEIGYRLMVTEKDLIQILKDNPVEEELSDKFKNKLKHTQGKADCLSSLIIDSLNPNVIEEKINNLKGSPESLEY